MSTIKIYPPTQLPAEGITDTQFAIWQEELEVYLEVEQKFRKFLPGGKYETWTPAEENPLRIEMPQAPDTENSLPDIRRELRQFITIIAKYVHQDYYNPIIRHSSSLKWIYTKIRQDYNIEQKGIFFLNILDLKWDPTAQTTPIGFYNQYRSMIIGNLAKRGDVVEWKNETLKEDEKLTASYEDMILLNVLHLLHPKLPMYVREQYAHKIGTNKRLMDYKTDILTNAKKFIQEIDMPQVAKISPQDEECSLNYMQTRPRQSYNRTRRGPPPSASSSSSSSYQRPAYQNRQHESYQKSSSAQQPPQQPPPFCRMCHVLGMPRHIYTSHYLAQTSCPSLSQRDKQLLATRTAQQLNNMTIDDDEIVRDYGYDLEDNDEPSEQVVIDKNTTNVASKSVSFSPPTSCNYIQPVPTQILTVQDTNNKDVHITLDSGATVSYIRLDIAKSHNFKIMPNSQLSSLGDGETKLPPIGEIVEIFSRNEWSVRFNAIVVKNLHADFVGGNTFIKENQVLQDFNKRTICVHRKYTVPETSPSLILPTQPNNLLLQNNHISVILPGQSIQYSVPHQESTTLAVQPWHQNKTAWPTPQLCTVKNGHINLKNDSPNPIHIPKATKIQARTTSDTTPLPPTETKIKFPSKLQEPVDNTNLIKINSDNIDPHIISYVQDIHSTYKDVFNEDLSKGYNHHFGKHIAKLNWATNTRPQANKIQHVNYDHETKVLLQRVCDDLTDKGVMGIPQEYNVDIQYCSPSFLVRKQKAKNKPKSELTKDDVRLVINFSKLNEFLKNAPTPITKPKEIFSLLGKWNYIIVMDLHSGFFQNHIDIEDAKWLGITTPFGGLRFMKRSGQGLISQSEELDELLSKVLSEEMAQGISARLADDLYVGGADAKEAADNYKKVLHKLQAANLKISPSKTKVFLKSVDVLGWVWQQGGYLSPSPHRVNAIKNTRQTDIVTIKDLRSWLGLYKTLLPSSPNLTLLLHHFDIEVADKDSKEEVQWTRELSQHFKNAIEAVDDLQTLYLPHPDDQLLIEVDAAKMQPGLGHTMYAVKDNRKLPVAFHSVKLSPSHSKWMACELEALAFATAIQAEYDVLKESKKPIIISPDSKTVADAIKMIKKGQYSSSPRIQSFINNINRIPISVQLASGKSAQNISSDYQSRHPSTCNSQHCSICNFTSEKSDAVLLPTCNNINTTEKDSMSNKMTWKRIQQEQKGCREAKQLLKSGKTPSKQSGKINSEIRRLCSVAKVNGDDMLIVETQPNKYSTKVTELIVVPQSHIPALLWQLHNSMQHPTRAQLKAQFDKSYYGVGLTPNLDKLYDECFYCSTQKKIPSTLHQTKTNATVPGTHFHADVIKRQGQNIFTIRDHLSSFSAAKIIKTENHQELKQAIIDTLSPIKLHGQCEVTVDNATGFIPLLQDKDPDLVKLNIHVTATDVNNKNGNAVIDRACYELEQELKRLEPDGRPVSNTTLQSAIAQLNGRLRRGGQISAFEMFFNRDMNTGQNLNLDYAKIRQDQVQKRNIANDKHNAKITSPPQQQPQPGDIVTVNKRPNKHIANDVYMVTTANDDKVKMQKILHPHSATPKLRNVEYVTESHRIHVARSCQPTFPTTQPKQHHPVNNWNPVRAPEDDSDDEYIPEDSNNHHETIDHIVLETTDNNNDSADVFVSPSSTPPQPTQRSASSPIPSFVAMESPISSPIPSSSSPLPENASERPQIYQDHDNWLQQQRAHAARQLLLANHPQNSQQHHHQPPPADRRQQQKDMAKQKISAIYGKNIPQIDGYVSEPSSQNTSPDSTEVSIQPPGAALQNISQNSNAHTSQHQQMGFYDQVITDYYDFLDRVDFMPHVSQSSLSWDDTDYYDAHVDQLFDTAPWDISFLPPTRRHTL